MQNHNDMLARPVAACTAAFITWMAFALTAGAANVYVVPPGTHEVDPGWDFTGWATAATNIQDAIDAAHVGDGDIVFITNGTYLLPDQITVNKGVILRSYMDGATAPEETVIDGNNYEGKPVTNRVMALDHEGAVLDGLTIQGGYWTGSGTYGAGLHVTQSQMITNCVIYDNDAGLLAGGGVYLLGNFGLITHCGIVSNYARWGGGIWAGSAAVGIIEHSTIEWNETDSTSASHGGGGIFGTTWGTDVVVRWCTIANNWARGHGGGVFLSISGMIENSLIISNECSRNGDGVRLFRGGTLRNSLVYDNKGMGVAVDNGGDHSFGTVENCTIVNNERGVCGEGTYINSIIYSNTVTDILALSEDSFFTNSCVPVDLTGYGSGNITNYPMFVDPEGDFRLQAVSPAANAGVNLGWMDDAQDKDGNPRIDPLYGKVDMGCYEYMFRGTVFRIR